MRVHTKLEPERPSVPVLRGRSITFPNTLPALHHTFTVGLMSFDTSTLYLFATMVAGMLGAMLIFFGKQENVPALKWWGTAYLLGAASVAIWTVGGAVVLLVRPRPLALAETVTSGASSPPLRNRSFSSL